jgi:hypothetical protein
MMRYNENMIRLLDPIIADGSDLGQSGPGLKVARPPLAQRQP